MTTYEAIERLCRERGIAITALEKELGFGRGSIGKLKKGGKTSTERVMAIADYFGVPVNSLLGSLDFVADDSYYLRPETVAAAQEIFDNPGLRILFDAARDSRPEDLMLVAEMLKRLKGTNRDS